MPFDQPFRHLSNPNHGVPGVVTLNAAGFRRAKAEITTWPGYAPTPLISLPSIANQLRLGALHIKDESTRFGLGSVKALGGAYAVLGALRAELARTGVASHATTADLVNRHHQAATSAITVCSATDGNHGRSVAWAAQRFGAACCIFVHEAVSPARIAAIAAYGAEIRRTPGNYGAAVQDAADAAEREGWIVVSDSSYSGYTEIPREIMQGYRLMVDEALDQLPTPPTHILIQAGGIAAAVSVHARSRIQPDPCLIIVEPDQTACFFASAQAGPANSIMAGQACGEPSLLAWQELDRAAWAFLAIPDQAATDAMQLLARHNIVSGESGAAGLAGLMLAAAEPTARAALALDQTSRVLLFNTEGATDPALYANLLAS